MTPAQADILETENVLLRQELLNAQAVELQLKGQLAQLQEDTAAMAHNHAGMRTTVACLRQPGVRFVSALYHCCDIFLLYPGNCVHMTKAIYCFHFSCRPHFSLQSLLQIVVLPIPSDFTYRIDFPVQPDTPHSRASLFVT